MFVRKPEDLFKSWQQTKAERILQAIDQREYEVKPWNDGLQVAIRTANNFFYAYAHDNSGTFNVYLGCTDYLTVDIDISGGTAGVFDDMDKSERLYDDMQTEALMDPEGAFGGRGNNLRI